MENVSRDQCDWPTKFRPSHALSERLCLLGLPSLYASLQNMAVLMRSHLGWSGAVLIIWADNRTWAGMGQKTTFKKSGRYLVKDSTLFTLPLFYSTF